MSAPLPLATMTRADKLRAMEALWDDLCADTDQVVSPEWHERVLADRQTSVDEGTARFADWGEVKARLRAATS